MKFMTFTEINEKLIDLVRNERQLTHEILNHILLFQKCNGHLKLGYSSMHQYLTRGLGYSDDQAYRRLKAVRLLNEIPKVADQFQAAKLNLSQMAEAQKAFETFERENKTPVKKEIKAALIATLEKANNFQTKSILNTELKLKPKTEEKINPQFDQTVRLELSLTKAQFEKLQTIKNLVSHQLPDLNTAKALELVFDFFISKKQGGPSCSVKSAKAENSRQVEKATKLDTIAIKMIQGFMPSMKPSATGPVKSQNKLENVSASLVETPKKRSRYIAVETKNTLFKRSHGRCEYVGPTGIRCGSQYKVQIDHQHKPFCFGGQNTIENLRNLCAEHNRFMASKNGIGFETTSRYC